ncbi:unnamed protein product [Ectocarpus sp. CCAP 1310/34]|nr:unnamed protein product [Ectocarpus sp. CCAP 1310/34]
MTSAHKPDLSGLPAFNVAGGRPDERFGTRGSFTRGVHIMSGGHARDVPLEAEVEHGKVLFVSAAHKPDLSAEARTNAVRPTERLGSRGRFTAGVRRWAGGEPRDVPLPRVRDPGTVLFESASERSRPSLSFSCETNVSGGREDERHGRLGSFKHGVVEARGGPLQVQAAFAREVEKLWHEGGQKENKYRRCGPSHFVAGVSILSGGMPVY